MKVAIVKYNAGNTGSVTNAFRRLGLEPVVTDDPETLQSADRVIFPGVGEASSAMASLRSAGMDRVIPALKQPVLGICLGMQLMCEWSEENNTECLGITRAVVKTFPDESFRDQGLKVPHIGWNQIRGFSGPLFEGVKDGEYVYFVHGYYVETSEETVAVCEYGLEFSAAVSKRNFYATQFHPEKSGSVGERILQNFMDIE